ncbi:MAG: sulfite exporter TauE/SafE family protein [Spirochaetaceae bacterium]|jgi:sulfite exporter TauE/SafE/copper chaperone CopZ|nr:sulfite exporter TauE/SafE family protein [Spirochaetaceae bacterium]
MIKFYPLMKNETFRIGGMTCVRCRKTIERALKGAAGISGATVDFNKGTARVAYDEDAITADEIAGIVKKLGYTARHDGERTPALEAAGTLVLILALFALMRKLGPGMSAFPVAEEGMSYGMLFVIGLLTSFHCAAMCGGINISQCMSADGGVSGAASKGNARLPRSAMLYNAGRVASYTAIGGIAGAAGSVASVPAGLAGIVQLVAGVFMVVMGISMLGFFPALRRFTPRLPKIFARKIDERKAAGKNPLAVGLLNGLMPCGPLQAMQLYARSTGNACAGAPSMCLVSAGTVPLMFGAGALSSLLSGAAVGPAFARRVTRAGAALVTVMGMLMFGYGLNLSGLSLDFAGDVLVAERKSALRPARIDKAAALPKIENGVQTVSSVLSGGRYPAIVVRQGLPVRWIIDAPAGSVNRMIIREYGIEYRFKTGRNVIEFMPERAGRFVYSCWMGMIRSYITVAAEDETLSAAEPGNAPSPAGRGYKLPDILADYRFVASAAY